MSLPASQRLLLAVAIALLGAYQLTRSPQDDSPARLATHDAEPPQLAAALQPRSSEPLRFDAPAAGLAASSTSGNPAYDACIDQPSFDGAVIECPLLLQKPAKPRRP